MSTATIKLTLETRHEAKQCAACGRRFSHDSVFCPVDGARLKDSAGDLLGDPLLGTTIDGRYAVLELLGEGGMGRVYRARHTSLDRTFAIKVLRADLARDANLSARFIHEAKVTASIKHPNVVQITDFGTLHDGVPYFVMELLVGCTLGQVLRAGGPLLPLDVARIARQVACGLRAAHEAGVVHRDLKPDNVFLVGMRPERSPSCPQAAGARTASALGIGSQELHVRVVDFGAAKVLGAAKMTSTGVVFGTPHYMSPEQASGQPVESRSDVYALGIIMYEMLTGRVPFEADTYMGVLSQHMFTQPLAPSRAPGAPSEASGASEAYEAYEIGALESIVLLCLAKQPQDRFASMSALVQALDDAIGPGEGRSATTPWASPALPAFEEQSSGAPGRSESASLDEMRVAIDSLLPPRRPVPWGAIAGVAVVLVASLAALSWGGKAPPQRSGAPQPHETAVVRALPTVPAAPATETESLPAAAPSLTSPKSATSPSSRPAVRRPPSHAPSRTISAIDDIGDPFATKP